MVRHVSERDRRKRTHEQRDTDTAKIRTERHRDTEREREREREMEYTDLKTPILVASQNGRGGGRLSRRSYSVKSLKKEFVLRLPDKLRSAGDLDPESETFGPDLSTISSLTKGLSLSLCVCVFGLSTKGRKRTKRKWCLYVCI